MSYAPLRSDIGEELSLIGMTVLAAENLSLTSPILLNSTLGSRWHCTKRMSDPETMVNMRRLRSLHSRLASSS